MKKIQAAFYTFEEMEQLLERCCFTNGEDFDIEVIDHYQSSAASTRTMGQMISVLHYLTLTHCRCFPK